MIADEAVRAFVAEHPSLEDALGRISTVAHLATLEETGTGRRLVVGNTHLFYHPQAVHVRILQAHQLLTHAHRAVHAEVSRRCAAAAAAHVLHLTCPPCIWPPLRERVVTRLAIFMKLPPGAGLSLGCGLP